MVVEGDPGEEQQDFREEGGVAHSNSSLLFFRNASAEDAGEYKCIAWNRGGVTMQVTAVVVGVGRFELRGRLCKSPWALKL